MREIEVRLPDRRVSGRWVGPESPILMDEWAPTLVFLHEGLGSVELWRGFPDALCARTGLRGFAYDRTGYGRSGGWPSPPGAHYMAIEADQVLPQVLDAVGIGVCVLVGHSDGGTIALNYAALQPPMLRGVVTLGAHAINEERAVASIRQAREAYVDGTLRARLERYHGDNVDEAFWLWNDAWLAPGFQPMDTARLPRVRVPVLALQGEHDEYGTVAQLTAIARGVSGRCDTRLLNGCGHGPHLQDEATTVEIVARFIATLWRRPTDEARRLAGLLALCLALWGTPGLAAAQSCDHAAERSALAAARARIGVMEEAGPALSAAVAAQPGCVDLAVAAFAVSGWEEGRRLTRVAGAPEALGPVNALLRRLDGLRAAVTPRSLPAQHASYAEALVRAAVAASQDEREEMQVYLAYATDLAAALAPARAAQLWPLTPDEAAGELWLEVDRFAEARTALDRVVAGPATARTWWWLGRVRERLGDGQGACVAYFQAEAGGLTGSRLTAVTEARRRLRCGGR